MSAELLLRAAAKIRETAAFATEGPWQIDHPTSRQVVRPAIQNHKEHRFQEVVVYDGGFTNDGDPEHVAAWSPDVALLVADVLTMAAIRHADLTAPGGPDDRDWPLTPAQADDVLRTELALARRILGDDQ